jgi:hypothetical protein
MKLPFTKPLMYLISAVIIAIIGFGVYQWVWPEIIIFLDKENSPNISATLSMNIYNEDINHSFLDSGEKVKDFL